MGRPRPRPLGAPCPLFSWALGFLMVSSTDRIRQAASDAAVMALILTTEGSQTQASKLSAMSSLLMSTPNHCPPGKKNIHTLINFETVWFLTSSFCKVDAEDTGWSYLAMAKDEPSFWHNSHWERPQCAVGLEVGSGYLTTTKLPLIQSKKR